METWLENKLFGCTKILIDRQMHFGSMNVILLHSGHQRFSAIVWTSSGW